MKRFLLLLSVLCGVALFNLATPGIMVAHDAPDHVARIANFYQSLSEGIVVPRWAANLNWGYGHPILMFLYPLPSYAASLFHFLGASFVDSVKIVFAVSFVASVVTFYLWASAVWGRIAGFVGAVLYGFAPYRFVDLYVRGAIGEHVAFVFPPLIFLGLFRLATGRKNTGDMLVIFGTAGILLSHNAVSIMVLPLVLVYAFYLSFSMTKDRIRFWKHTCASLALGLSMSAFFWIPAFFEGKYTLRDIVTRGDFSTRFVPFLKFFYSPWNYGGTDFLTKEVGLAQWVAVVGAGVLAIRNRASGIKTLTLGVVVTFFGSLFIQTDWSRWIWETISLLQKFQFPWRFLTVSVLMAAISGSLVTALVKRNGNALGWFLVVLAVVSTSGMWRAKSYMERPESYYTGIYDSTTDTGESSPVWSVRFMEHRPSANIQILEGAAEIQEVGRTTISREYRFDVADPVRAVENTLYFPGWRVFVDGTESSIEFQDPAHRGLMTFRVPAGTHTVTIQFGDTKVRKAANFLTILSLFVLIGVGTIRLWQQKRRRSR